MTVPGCHANPTAHQQALKRLLQSECLILYLSALCFAAMALSVPGFASPGNLRTIVAYLLPILLASVGLTFVLISGGIDLSLTSIIALTSVFGGQIMSADVGWLGASPWAMPAGLAGMLAIGLLLGALNGFNVAVLRLPPFIATLTLMMFGSGFAIWFTQSRKIFGLPLQFTQLAGNLLLEILLVAACFLLAHLLLSRTLFGSRLYAVGHNPRAALVAGVPVTRIRILAYMLSGLFAALSAVLFTAGLETGDPEMARTALLDIVGATVIGGTSLYGGKGRITWTLYGVLFLALIDNSLNLLGATLFAITMVKGIVILLAAMLDALRNRLLAS
jgi:ribose/xylose/arabinose/galactoside ABC-type transport system permease subunit